LIFKPQRNEIAFDIDRKHRNSVWEADIKLEKVSQLSSPQRNDIAFDVDRKLRNSFCEAEIQPEK
jgi:hypothetical protein